MSKVKYCIKGIRINSNPLVHSYIILFRLKIKNHRFSNKVLLRTFCVINGLALTDSSLSTSLEHTLVKQPLNP